MLLAPGEIAERKWIFRAADNAEISLNARTKPDAGLCSTASDDRLDQRMPDEMFRDRFRFLRRHDQVEIADNFFPTPITPGKADL